MSESFAQLFEESLANQRFRPGQILTGQVMEVGSDFVIVNAENSAGGFGITETILDELLEAGADVPRLGVFGRVTGMIRHYLFGWWS